MNIYTLERKQEIPRPIDEVFQFFEAPEHLDLMTPSWLHFSIITPLPIFMRVGTLIDYGLRWLGIPLHWRTLITTYDPPHRFVDEQIRGPYAFWHHTHEFAPSGHGTRMRDIVRYAIPFGPVGAVLHPTVIRRQLEQIFDHRASVITNTLGRQSTDADARMPEKTPLLNRKEFAA